MLITLTVEVSNSNGYCFGCRFVQKDTNRVLIYGRTQKKCVLFNEPLFMDQDHDCERLTICKEYEQVVA